MEEKKELLRIEHLTVSFAQYEKRSAKQGELPVIRDLNVTVREGEIVAVVGSSGSGKSLLAHAIMGILPANAAASGSIFYRGSACGEAELKALRGREIALVPQSVNYLDPLMKVGRQIIGETKKRQKLFCVADQGKRQAEARMRDLLGRYGLADEVADTSFNLRVFLLNKLTFVHGYRHFLSKYICIISDFHAIENEKRL